MAHGCGRRSEQALPGSLHPILNDRPLPEARTQLVALLARR